ncbi:N-acetylglucosamine-6-phosphate deacetylase [Conexibacter arvalis]|uniref:N-acetylglucosamine-6-phosphate deacetylase n=1 Tax=Conexibacter arvalis TaxID=912552 RepID=A0A840IAM9_9ACTN|nr:N-acetylglucosamine-6-phosphate deacetylase [Conexibacter arvalis]MBB4661311.1 N-acetylglucosamine-6-phosphate deacetylase [Conexibacter arvalis]
MGDLILRGGRVVTPGGVRAADVVVRAGRIAAVAEVDGAGGGAAEVVDLADRWLLPGFVDLHVHGGGGAQFNTTDPDEVRAAARFHAAHGTTALLASTVAAPVDELVGALEAIEVAHAAPLDGVAEVLGAHLEGPFLSARWPGAMDGAAFLDPDAAALDALLAAGPVRSMTIAPELPGALALIARLRDAGALVALGHSDASYAEVERAVAAGARAVTHAFNAMRPLHHRDPGLLAAALDLPALACEVIADGVHVDPVMVRLLQRLKGAERTLLVTDAIEATGLPDGDYRLGGRAIAVAGGRATLAGAETIAGAALTMEGALRNAVAFCGVPVEQAARMAATTPAQLLGIADRKGSIAPGRDADLVVLGDDLALAGVLARGVWARPLA